MIVRHLKVKATAFPVWVFYLPLVMLILAAILAPIGRSTKEDPTGGASAMAPILVLSVVTIGILQSWLRLGGSAARLIKVVTSVGMIFSAYFWLAAEGDVYPYSTQLIGGLSLVAAVMVGATAVVLFPFLSIWILTPEPEDKVKSLDVV